MSNEPMTPERLREVAKTLDSLSRAMLALMKRVGDNRPDIEAILKTTEMQDDIRIWADILEQSEPLAR